LAACVPVLRVARRKRSLNPVTCLQHRCNCDDDPIGAAVTSCTNKIAARFLSALWELNHGLALS